jgi:hypothetical protein
MPLQTASETVQCNFCNKEFHAQGLKSHQRACPACNRDTVYHAESGHYEDPFNAILEANERAG